MASCQITKNRINPDLIKIIQLCLKIYDLWRDPHLWMGVWMVWWMGGLMGRLGGVMRSQKLNKS